MLLMPVQSSDLAAAGYDPVLFEMQIQFKTGSIYSYANVAPDDYATFLMAPSKGGWVAMNLRKNPGVFPVTRIL